MVAAAGAQQVEVARHGVLPCGRARAAHVVHQLRGRGIAGRVLIHVVRRLEEVRHARPGERRARVRREDRSPVFFQQAVVDAAQPLRRNRLIPLDQPVRLQLVVGEEHLVVERADNAVNGVLEEDDALFTRGGAFQHVVQEQGFAERRRHFGHEDRVVGVDERLRLVREQGVDGVAHLVRHREHGVEGVVVVHQHVRVCAVHRGGVRAAPLALVLVDVDPAAGERLAHPALVVLAERRHGLRDPVDDLVVRVLPVVVDQRHEGIEDVVLVESEHALPERVVAPERFDAGPRLADQVLHHGGRDVVAEERRIERRRIPAGPRVEPLALHHAVVERGVGVQRRAVGVVERLVGRPPIRLVPARGEQPPVLAVGHLHGFARGQRDGLEPRVGGREGGVGVWRHGSDAGREGHQAFAAGIEHALLLPEQVLDHEAVDGQRRRLVQPGTERGEWNPQDLRVEPRGRLLPPGHEQLHLLPAGVDGVVALILVVLQRRVVPDLVGELSQPVAVLEGLLQDVGPLGQPALVARVPGDGRVQLREARFPVLPGREDGTRVPLVPIRDLGARRHGGRGGMGHRRGHPAIILWGLRS